MDDEDETLLDIIDISVPIRITSNAYGSIHKSNPGHITTIDSAFVPPNNGHDVTLEIDGETHSMRDLIKSVNAINDRLCVLIPDPDLLEEHEMLQDLYEQYKITEALLKSKMKKKERRE